MSWRAFAAAREDLLRALSTPILSALGREGTPSPIFHGFDWHSAVHGVYSLYAIYQRTGDDLYLEAAEQHVRAGLVADELRYMSSTIAASENPYGFSWMLALVARQEQATGMGALRPLAEYAVDRIAGLVAGLDEQRAFALATNDPNLSFTLIHLALCAPTNAHLATRRPRGIGLLSPPQELCSTPSRATNRDKCSNGSSSSAGPRYGARPRLPRSAGAAPAAPLRAPKSTVRRAACSGNRSSEP